MSISNVFKKLNCRDTRLFPKLPKINKKIKIASILVALVFLTFLSHQIFASTVTIDKSAAVEKIKAKQAAVSTGNNQESWMSEAATSNILVGVNAVFGTIPNNVLDGTAKTTWIPGGLIGLTNNGIASLYNQPISGVKYIAQTVNSFLGKPAYAMNSGYQGLSSLIPIWKGFRNVTYSIFSIIFIMIGIMIMLRVKISQQAVLTIQSAIPKLITSLILVTFSYAIVGLLIDLSYVVESLGVSLIISASGKAGTVADIIKNPDVMGRITGLFPMLTLLYLSLVVAGIVAVISAITGTMGILGAVALAAIWLVIGIMILWYTIKFFLGLVKCYVSIILKTVVAPLEIAMGAIPNMKMGFGSWFVDIIANILVFPISIIFLVLLDALITATSGKVLWSPPGIDVLNNLTAGSGGILPVALGLGGLMLIAKLPKMIPEFIFQIKPSPWGKAIGEGFAPIGGFFGKTAKGGAEYGVQSAGKGMSDKWGDADKGWRKAAKQIGQGIQFFKR